MGLISENVIPGDHGKIFGTDAKTAEQFEVLKKAVMRVDGVIDVQIVQGTDPYEIVIRTNKLVSVIDVENAVKHVGMHAIPKGWFIWQ
ncbi:heavy-metal-associated domain-containing protein [Mangrovimonas aestuarii]|uniref:heavy-metal-associated domain-containing protein n=1 Tax=Mangrovimonas aestuarii TaxID=3018443 RepID=UPI002378D3EB|nr:heavy-metal-associated domain-containing protein [Mangrovimonas aestuarii]